MHAKIASWARSTMPTREQMEQNRFIRPLAQRHELWRFTRRSVPWGVAVGLWVGIFALIPGIQIVGAALMCVPFRGNIPISAGMTFLSNPATTPLIVAASIWLGNKFGFHADLSTFYALYEQGAGVGRWMSWLLSDAAPALLFGLFIISTVAAVVGYIVSAIGWRWWTAHKRRTRLARAAARDYPE